MAQWFVLLDFERYDLENHPQNKIPNTIDVETLRFFHRRSPMPETSVTVTDWLPDIMALKKYTHRM